MVTSIHDHLRIQVHASGANQDHDIHARRPRPGVPPYPPTRCPRCRSWDSHPHRYGIRGQYTRIPTGTKSLPVGSVDRAATRAHPAGKCGVDTYHATPVRQRSSGLTPTRPLYATFETGPDVRTLRRPGYPPYPSSYARCPIPLARRDHGGWLYDWTVRDSSR